MDQRPEPPFLVFPAPDGAFLVFHGALAVFPGPALAAAEDEARARSAWLAGGLEYGPAERPAPGWWGVFPRPDAVSRATLEGWSVPGFVAGPLAGPTQEAYRPGYEAVRRALADGTSYQANLTLTLRGRAVSGGPWSWPAALGLWLRLVAAQGREAAFAVLGTADSPGPVVASASPELFFRREGSLVEARPMKGTALRSPDPVEDRVRRADLAASPKNRAENLMITDMIRNDLGRVAVPGSVTVPSLFDVEAYPTVWQMTSTVQARVPEATSLDGLMAALFPCASITGAPKVRTQGLLAGAEAEPRGWYTGTLGWHRPASAADGPPRSRFSVLIRTLVFDRDDGAFRLGVGGGVVWDSTEDGEYAEAWAKARFLDAGRRDFGLTEALLWEPGSGYFLWDEHLARLTQACRDFGHDLDPGAFAEAVEAGRRRTAETAAGPLKLRVIVDPEGRIRVEGEVLSSLPEVLTAGLAAAPLGPETLVWRRYKTDRRQVYQAGHRPHVDQTIFYNERGELTESTSMNLVLEVNGRRWTPAGASGLLAGTFRQHLLATGQVSEAVLPVEALGEADRVWLVNSVRRWKPVRLVPDPLSS